MVHTTYGHQGLSGGTVSVLQEAVSLLHTHIEI